MSNRRGKISASKVNDAPRAIEPRTFQAEIAVTAIFLLVYKVNCRRRIRHGIPLLIPVPSYSPRHLRDIDAQTGWIINSRRSLAITREMTSRLKPGKGEGHVRHECRVLNAYTRS